MRFKDERFLADDMFPSEEGFPADAVMGSRGSGDDHAVDLF
jgi:hypothetical protein